MAGSIASTPSTTRRASPTTPTGPAAERRQLTIMFCDMVGSSALSTRLDPEEQGEVIAAFHACCAKEIKSLDGMVAQYMGDGVLAYFGYPIAHEADAERAIRAGLAILSSVNRSKPRPAPTIQARVGIATGVVVVGDLVRGSVTQENAAIGETTNLAARLQSLAEPNSIVISPLTHQLVGALFDYRDLGLQNLKGFGSPVHVRQVLRTSTFENRFEARHQAMLSPLQGRGEDLELLARRWHQVKGGEGAVVLLSGEPGIGKSRTIRALLDRLSSEEYLRLTFHCSPHHQDTALYPVVSHLQRAAGIEQDNAPEIMFDKLRTLVAQSGTAPAGEMAALAALLSIPTGDRGAPQTAASQLKEHVLAALIGLLKRHATRQAVLMMFEDLHWIDPTSLEFLSRIVDEAPALHLLVVATARPEFTAPWPNHRHVSTIGLSRLSRPEGRQLVFSLTHGKTLPDDVMDTILSRTDGVPLFIEELTKTILESGLLREVDDRFELTGPLPPLAIPSTLHASLLARLDRLAPVREVAQIAAVIGREFSYGLIAAVANRSEQRLQDALSELAKAELIFQRGVPPDATYVFKHALVQDAAYASLLRPKREQLHTAIAESLQQRQPDIARQAPEVLARHYSAAGLDDRAKDFWVDAGRGAMRMSYYPEAISHFSNALTIVRRGAGSKARTREESELLLDKAVSIGAYKGNGSDELGTAAAEAVTVSAPLGDDPLHFRAKFADWLFYSMSGKLPGAATRADTLVGIADRLDTSDVRLQAYHAVWTTSYLRGDIAAARAAIEHGLALYDFGAHRGHITLYGAHDAGVCARARGSCVLFQAGFPDRAARLATEGIELGNKLDHPYSRCLSLWHSAFLSMLTGNAIEALELSERVIALAQSFKLALPQGIGRMAHGWAMTRLGEPIIGLEEMETAFRAFVDSRQLVYAPFFGTFIAAAKLEMNRVDESLDMLRHTQRLADETHQQSCMSEVHRLRAEGLRKRGESATHIGAEYRSAIALARKQGARMLELRAATGLADHWRGSAREADTLALLAPIYRSFTEGHDTPDLTRAKMVLDQLGAS